MESGEGIERKEARNPCLHVAEWNPVKELKELDSPIPFVSSHLPVESGEGIESEDYLNEALGGDVAGGIR